MSSSQPGAIFDASKAYSPLSIADEHTALLLMDYHQIFVTTTGDNGAAALEAAKSMRSWALAHNMPVYHCLIDMRTAPVAHARLNARWSTIVSRFGEDGAGAAEHADLAPPEDSAREKTVTRTPGLFSVCYSGGLLQDLRQRNVRSLLLAGLSTSGCVLSTARSATDEGFVVTVIEDACADPVPSLHDMLTQHAFQSSAHVATSKEIQAAWSR